MPCQFYKKLFSLFFVWWLDNHTEIHILLIMEAKLYSVSGLFETGTEIATFDRSREGLEQAYDFVGNAFAWQIKCGSELVDECDPWREDDEAEARAFA